MTPSRSLLLCSITLAAASLSSCVPYYFIDATAVSGHVVDRTTKRPVAGARVVLSSIRASVQAQTDQSGDFRLPALRHWTTVPLITDGFYPNGSLRIEAAGYKPYAGQEAAFGGGGYGTGSGGLQRVHIMLAPEGSKYESSDDTPHDVTTIRVPTA